MEDIRITKEEIKEIVTSTINAVLGKLKTSEPNEYMNVAEASTFLGMATSTIYKMVCLNTIPYYKPNGTLLFKRSELEKWVDASRISTHKEMDKQTSSLAKLYCMGERKKGARTTSTNKRRIY